MTTILTTTHRVITLEESDYPITIEAVVETNNKKEIRKYILIQNKSGRIEFAFEKKIIIEG